MLLNQHPHQRPYGIRASLDKQMEKYYDQFLTMDNIILEVFTWNCAGQAPPPNLDIHDLLAPADPAIVPDIYVIGLQEIVKLNAKSVIEGKNSERVALWLSLISRSLAKNGLRYFCLDKKAMVGCLILLFVKEDQKDRVSNIVTSKVKTGFGG